MSTAPVFSAADQHDPTDACLPVHCHSHNVDEPDEPCFIYCFECGHVYPTARSLRRAYRLAYRLMDGRLSLSYLRALFIRAKAIHFCQECIHDF